jgi:hypothetical protein
MEGLAPRQVKQRVRPALLHLLGSLCIVGLVTVLLVRLWFPTPYSKLSGGLELLVLLMVVDVVLGPVLTLVVAAPGKPMRVLARDLAVILAVQLTAFGYGLYTMALARPVGLVFEVNHMRLISSADIDPDLLHSAPAGMRELSWTGPRVFASVKPTDAKELLEAIDFGLAGVDLGMFPKHWRPYSAQQATAWQVATPVAALIQQHPRAAGSIERTANDAGVPVQQMKVLPIRARKSDDWVALIAAPDARVVGLMNPTQAD